MPAGIRHCLRGRRPLLNQPRLFVVLKNSQKARDCEDDEKNNKPHHRLTHAHSSSNLSSKSIINRPRPIVNGFLIFAAIFRKSNSRSRKGCDDNIFATKAESPGFNSRTRKGCDELIRRFIDWYFVSIHAPVKGATYGQVMARIIMVFQFTHP